MGGGAAILKVQKYCTPVIKPFFFITINCFNLYTYVPIFVKSIKRCLQLLTLATRFRSFLRPFSSHMSIALRTLADVMLKDKAIFV